MSVTNTIRAWKDEEYLAGLPEAVRAQLPANPAGSIGYNLGLVNHGNELDKMFSTPHCHASIVIECSASNCG